VAIGKAQAATTLLALELKMAAILMVVVQKLSRCTATGPFQNNTSPQ